MHILIENEETLEYPMGENNWSKSPLKGKQFLNHWLAWGEHPIANAPLAAYSCQVIQRSGLPTCHEDRFYPKSL